MGYPACVHASAPAQPQKRALRKIRHDSPVGGVRPAVAGEDTGSASTSLASADSDARAAVPLPDIAVVGQDPWLRGGYRSQAAAFWSAAAELGREPHLFCIAHDRATSLVRHSLAVRPRRVLDERLSRTAYPAIVPELGALNHVINASRIKSALARAGSVWVVTTSAHYGFPAAVCGRPYACWVGTGFTDEAAARCAGLPLSRRLSLRMNAPVYRQLEREVLKRAAAVYATSPTSRRAVVAAADLDPDAVGLLPIAIDANVFRPELDEAWYARLDAPIVVFVGRSPDPRKNVGLLVDAFAEIGRRLPRARLRIVGRLPRPSSLSRVPPRVELTGEVASVVKLLRTSTLFVLPSIQEGFGVAVAEALACGVPAVVTPCGGPEEMIHRSGGGRVLSSFRRDELAETVVELLRDPARLLEMRARGREYVLREHAPGRLVGLLARAFRTLDGD